MAASSNRSTMTYATLAFTLLLPLCYYIAANNPGITKELNASLKTEWQLTVPIRLALESFFGKTDIGTISFFIVFYTGILILTILFSWYYGGKKALTISILAWNLEILFYNLYSGKFVYSVEHINIFFFLLYFVQSPSDKKESQLREMEHENRRLAELKQYELIHKRMFGEASQTINQSHQHLQSILFTWRNIIHDLKNKITVSDYNQLENDIAEKVIKPNVEMIIDYLKKLPATIDVELNHEHLGELYRLLADKYAVQGRSLGIVQFGELPAELAGSSYHLLTNRHRLDSIIFNLIQNSAKAVSKRKDYFREKGQRFSGLVEISFGLSQVEAQPHLVINVKDNGGGFPEEIVPHIYKTPIPSSDESKGPRLGEGTTYVGFFVEFMKGRIEAANVMHGDETRGAQTTLQFPLLQM